MTEHWNSFARTVDLKSLSGWHDEMRCLVLHWQGIIGPIAPEQYEARCYDLTGNSDWEPDGEQEVWCQANWQPQCIHASNWLLTGRHGILKTLWPRRMVCKFSAAGKPEAPPITLSRLLFSKVVWSIGICPAFSPQSSFSSFFKLNCDLHITARKLWATFPWVGSTFCLCKHLSQIIAYTLYTALADNLPWFDSLGWFVKPMLWPWLLCLAWVFYWWLLIITLRNDVCFCCTMSLFRAYTAVTLQALLQFFLVPSSPMAMAWEHTGASVLLLLRSSCRLFQTQDKHLKNEESLLIVDAMIRLMMRIVLQISRWQILHWRKPWQGISALSEFQTPESQVK